MDMDLFSVLLGAIVGALGSYGANYYTAQKKMEDDICRLHCLLIMEVSSHQSRLFRELDNLLQPWLERERGHTPFKYSELQRNIYYLKLPIFYFKQFLGDLIYSPSLLGIANYYKSVEWLNQESTDLEQNKDEERLAYSYIYGCATVLKASVDFMDELLKTKDIKRHENAQLRAKIDLFKHSKTHYQAISDSIESSRVHSE